MYLFISIQQQGVSNKKQNWPNQEMHCHYKYVYIYIKKNPSPVNVFTWCLIQNIFLHLKNCAGGFNFNAAQLVWSATHYGKSCKGFESVAAISIKEVLLV